MACFDVRWSPICTVFIIFIALKSSSNKVGVIVGATVGGGIGLIVLATAGVYTYKKKYRNHNTIN